ncbi:diacylglycerol kinase family protein [Geobacter sp. SVR]|uniref:diacylglycerol/lipid kinase family protein n=1 Tax=Geobacter sp. SVR TaxID=2495594 RepID=UPI00143EF6A9|nr:diacylglycerol kinase family protein [Geobacter sp. SVR]BCS53378.1 diacylglycerol kinase [Geobacter sp. SVR]GCF85496.1 diacylglycerol kinase [Geobacter sp. SVR]
MTTSHLFINPLSGRHRRRSVSDLVSRLARAGLHPQVHSVTTPADVLGRCRAINQGPASPLVIVAAGDGTVNAVVNGLLPETATLAVLPLGTSNVLAAELGIASVEEGIARIVAGRTRPFPVGLLHLEESSHRFVLMAGIGLDASVVRDVWPLGKRLLKQGAYAISALLSTLTWDKSLIAVHAGGATRSCHSVIVCSASRYGGDFILAPEGCLFSPDLTAICIDKHHRRTYLRLAFELLSGRARTSREIFRMPADGIEITGIKPVQLDGDFVGYTPARITMVPDFARIIV